MLNLNSLMFASSQPKVLADFYTKVFNKPADMAEQDWFGWQVGVSFFGVGGHSEIKGESKEPSRIMFNLETADVKSEFERIKSGGAKVVKDPYEMRPNMWIATFADPDGNYFQLMSPWNA